MRLIGSTFCLALLALSQLVAAAPSGVDRDQYEIAVRKATDYLSSKGRAQDGSYSAVAGPALTALVTTALLKHGRPPDDPTVAQSLAYLVKFVQPDGGIYKTDSFHRNYETSLTVVCLKAANRDGRYDELLADADRFLKGLQWDEGEDLSRSDSRYGGAGYGSHDRPDLSNTSFMIEALVATGNEADSEAIQRALIFISRCQNLETEHNTTPFAAKNPDGGFYYTPAAGGTSQAGLTETGGLKSYGSMTYAGLKSMIYAGLDRDDPRVKAAVAWIQKNYHLDHNPGMGSSGLYYYYHTLAKALGTMELDRVRDAAGEAHNWRAELVNVLADRQQADGSWVNENARWLEGDPNLVTAYALLALTYCRPD